LNGSRSTPRRRGGPRTAVRPEPGLQQSVAGLRGVGPGLAERLARLGVERCADLACLLPLRYEDRTQARAIGSLRPGERVLVEGTVELAEVAFRRRRTLLCRIADGTGGLTMRLFHFNGSQQQALARGTHVRCFGEVRIGPTGLEMVHPEYQVLSPQSPALSAALTAIYPSTEGLHQQRLRGLVQQVLALLEQAPLTDHLRSLLPPGWPELNAAIRYLHEPPRDADREQLAGGMHPCQRRLALEELVAQRLSLKRTRLVERLESSHAMTDRDGLLRRLLASLPFALTSAQQRALEDIKADLGRAAPMHRLLQGDVGSGKTVVAGCAAALAASSGFQVAIMAPTELLAEQHWANFDSWLAPMGLQVALLSGSLTPNARGRLLPAIESGQINIVVGTHALFQDAVRFAALGLIVIDEQHRFGVEQRLQLRAKGVTGGRVPHQLVMTATPIPRTLAMTAYADLDCSIIDELPPGRQPVRTVVMPEQRRSELVQRLTAHCGQGYQAYWVCPLIEESELSESQAAIELERGLREALPGLAVGLIHGRMKSAAKEQAMRDFKAGHTQLLVATTVIEVGVDVPAATLMVIENAERMGLAQLHQLRGRVGRGPGASSCVLLYRAPLTDVARERLNVMRETNDGFRIAQKDLELRGPGEVLGTRQTGIAQLRVADLLRDADLLPTVVSLSDRLLDDFPDRVEPLVRRWLSPRPDYASV
jgi:ATP-dependent DNA helicase RecG